MYHIDAIKHRFFFYLIAGGITLFAILSILFVRLNYGIDMTGWIQLEYAYENNIDIEKIRSDVENEAKKITYNGANIVNSTQTYKISGENKFALIVGFNQGNVAEKDLEGLKSTFRTELLKILKNENSSIEESQYVNIGKSFGDYIKNTAILTLVISIVWIAIYIAYAFSGFVSGISPFSFGVITIVTLFHDVLVAFGIYIFISLFYKEFQIDTFTITALLTILGYSINDTIIVSDRIRTNLRKFGGKSKKKLGDIINDSINETLVRSIYTSLTLFIVLVAIFFFWPVAIKGFILVMIIGVLIGTYSSIFIASPMLYDINKNKELHVYQEKKYNPDDKIVV